MFKLSSPPVSTEMFAGSAFTINLSPLVLTPAQISLLDKGLTYIPATQTVPHNIILERRDRNIGNIKLRDFFQDKEQDYDPKAFKNRFKNRSSSVPPVRGLTPQAIRACNNITDYIHKHTANKIIHGTAGNRVKLTNVRFNLTLAEKTALQQLKNNRDIVIKPADKGGAIGILDKRFYEAEGFRQLTNPTYYKEITAPLGAQTSSKINSILNRLHY